MPADEDLVFEEETHRLCKYHALEITPFTLQIVDRIVVGHLRHRLGDDRPFIKIRCDEVTRCSDEFHPALERTPIRVTPDKGGEKRVVDIDDLARERVDKLRAQHTHIPCKHY